MPQHKFLHNLLNELENIANKMGLLKDPVQYYFFTIADWYDIKFETVSI
jgi:hypothetical protein